MSVTDTGPRATPSATGPADPAGPAMGGVPPKGPRRPRSRAGSRRGAWALLIVLVVAVAAIAWIITHAKSQPAGGPGGAARGGAGGRGGRRGGGFGGGGGVTSVNVARAAVQDVPVYLSALGTVTPEATVTVRTQINGQLFSVAFREGQMVRKGQVLAQVDPRPYQQALAQAQGNLTRDQALLANAQLDLKRYQTLLSQDSIARQTVDTQAALVRQDEGVVATDRAAVGAAKLNLAYTRITAPVGGKVGLRQVDPGNFVTTGDANGLVTITQINPIDVVFTIPEDNVSQVNARMNSGAHLQVDALDRTQQNQLATGVLSTLDNQIDTTTGTVKAKARFANGSGVLYPNQFVNVRLLVNTVPNAVVAPTSAVLHGQQGLFVWVVDRNRTVHMRPVQTGPATGEVTSITSGLQPGETVVTDGSDRLREDGRVMLPGDCPPPMGMMGGGRGGRGGRGGAGGQAPAKSGGLFGLFGKKPAAEAPTPPGVGPDGQRCTPVNYAAGGEFGGRGMQQLYAQLNLDPTQQKQIDAITANMRTQMGKLRDSGDYQGMRALGQNMRAQVDAVLRPDQRAKLAQLRAQQQAQNGGMGGGGMGGGGWAGARGAGGAQPGAAVPSGAGPSGPEGGAMGNPAAPPTNAPPAPTAGGSGASYHGARAPLSPPVSATPQTAPSPAGGQAGGGGGSGRMFAMLGALNLDAGQQAQARAIFAQARAQAGDDPDARRAAMRAAFGRLEAILRPAQKAKLQAMREQMRGGGGAPPGGG